jgi:hypothetical protein
MDKNREGSYLYRLLRRMGYKPDRVIAGERPDFIVVGLRGEKIGVEITEVLHPHHGRQRACEWDVTEALTSTVGEFIRGHDGSGAFIHGSVTRLPQHRRELGQVRRDLEVHLEKHGGALRVDDGEMDRRFDYPFGHVECIQRDDAYGRFEVFEDNPLRPLAHKRMLVADEHEALIRDRVQSKVQAALGYDRRYPLWLGLRNRYPRVMRVSDGLISSVSELNQGVYSRIVMFNDPEDVLEGGVVPGPQYLDLLHR